MIAKLVNDTAYLLDTTKSKKRIAVTTFVTCKLILLVEVMFVPSRFRVIVTV